MDQKALRSRLGAAYIAVSMNYDENDSNWDLMMKLEDVGILDVFKTKFNDPLTDMYEKHAVDKLEQ